jgi:phage baseplate assembly protein W
MTDLLGTGIAFPLRVNGRGGLALVSDDRDVREAIGLILATAPGERPMRPEFGCGLHEYVFDSIDARTLSRMEHAIRVALDRWEPRIEVQDVSFDLAYMATGEVRIEISYVLRATSDVRNLVFPFYMVPAEEPA